MVPSWWLSCGKLCNLLSWGWPTGAGSLGGRVPVPSLLPNLPRYRPALATTARSCSQPHAFHAKRIPHRPIYRPIWWRHFLSWSSLFPDDPSLSQVNRKHKYIRVQTMEVPLLQGDFSYVVKEYPSLCRETPSLNLQIRECVASQIRHLPRKNPQSRSLSLLRLVSLILLIHCLAPNKFYFN